MKRLTSTLLMSFLFFVGCTTAPPYNVATVSEQHRSDSYCHKKLEPIGPTDPARIAQSGSGDFIDYSGHCDGPSLSDQIRKQKRFERFRFGRDYMDEG